MAVEFRKMVEFLSDGRTVKPDAQGRVVLPADVIAQAKLPDEVVLRGIDDHIELWRPDEYQAARTAAAAPDIDKMMHEAAQLMGDEESVQA